jgi:hypothetical protein
VEGEAAVRDALDGGQDPRCALVLPMTAVSISCGIGFLSASVYVATKRAPRAIATAKTSAVRLDVDRRDMLRRSESGARSGR